MQRAQQVIDSLVLRAPLDGVVSLKENRNAAGGMFFGAWCCPSIAKAIRCVPGQPVADVIESGRMEVRAKIDENDRGNLTAGQQATVSVDALPGEVFVGQGRRAVGPGQPRELLRQRQRRAGCST